MRCPREATWRLSTNISPEKVTKDIKNYNVSFSTAAGQRSCALTMWEKEKTRPTVRATSEEEVDDVEALVEAVVVETNCGREAEVTATTTWEDSEESSKDLNTLATHTPAEQGPSHHSPN